MVVVAAVDGESGSERVISEAQKLAEAFGQPLRILYVHERTSHPDRVNEYMDVAKDPSEEEVIGFAGELIDDLASGLSIEYESIGRVGNPPEEILEYAEETDASYIVIGGRSQSPVGKALFGNVTQSVLLDSDRPVLAVMDR